MAFTVVVVASAVFIFVVYKRFVKSSRRIPRGLKPLPGPKGYPIVGSVPEIPEKNSFIKFADWGKEYGPIYQVDLAGSNHIWISSDQISKDLLAKKGSIYSDRPHIPALISDNRTSSQYLPLLSKNDGWTRQRKFANVIMRESEKSMFHRYPELEAKRMLVELLDEPARYNHALESFVSRVTCRLAWGHSEASDELKQRARELLIGVSPTGALGNKLPFIMWLPDRLVPAKAWERRRAATERRFFEIMQSEVEEDIRAGRAPCSWMKTFLVEKEKWGFQYALEGAYAVGMHGIAGALTIAAPMQTFCLAMCFYPQYLPMLHEELDRVCGDRLPRAEDRRQLPFLRAVIRECLRWRPPVPTGIPHYLSQDDEYMGYHIPKGSTMHPLEWAIARDPEQFPDPEAFNPCRWIDPAFPTYKEPLTDYPTIINCSQFGYGRRVCQGQTVADEDLLIGIASIAWLFTMNRSPEGNACDGAEHADCDVEGVVKVDVVVDPEGVESGSENEREADDVAENGEEKDKEVWAALGILPDAAVPQEELNTDMHMADPSLADPSMADPSLADPNLEQIILGRYAYPGAFGERDSSASASASSFGEGSEASSQSSISNVEDEARSTANSDDHRSESSSRSTTLESSKKARQEEKSASASNSKKKAMLDPTLDFTTLLIAKPLPFKFELRPRDAQRVEIVRGLFEEGVRRGEYSDVAHYWGEDEGRTKELGWGKV